MKESQQSTLSAFVRLSQPQALLVGVLFYAMGGGIAHYMGQSINWTTYWLGQACATMLQLSIFYLKAVYDLPINENHSAGKPDEGGKDGGESTYSRSALLLLSTTTLTIGAVITVLLFANGTLNTSSLMMLGLAFLISFFYSVPPFRLVYSGYGELALSFLMANFFPALAFLLQVGNLHRLLAMTTFPITALYLAMLLALSLEGYAADEKFHRKTLMIRLGWQRAMNMHNLLVLFGFLLFGLAAILGLPWLLTWPGLLGLPLGLFQIWQMSSIAAGAKPHWRLLSLNAVATVVLTAYLVTFTLWTH
jgi:1,4-dihydroxy-2-naphthoate octaprenyltransferase